MPSGFSFFTAPLRRGSKRMVVTSHGASLRTPSTFWLLRYCYVGHKHIGVVGPYLDLMERYPDIRDMAEADVNWLREWFRPLGLVNRAPRLVDAANTILEQHDGEVPKDLSEIESLPGLGRYSACAVLCLAHAGAAPMIDESSGRLLRRLLGLSSSGPAYSDKDLFKRAQRLIPYDASRRFNLGLLDIAAAYCHVGSPDCVQCPLRSLCVRGRQATADLHGAGTHA